MTVYSVTDLAYCSFLFTLAILPSVLVRVNPLSPLSRRLSSSLFSPSVLPTILPLLTITDTSLPLLPPFHTTPLPPPSTSSSASPTPRLPLDLPPSTPTLPPSRRSHRRVPFVTQPNTSNPFKRALRSHAPSLPFPSYTPFTSTARSHSRTPRSYTSPPRSPLSRSSSRPSSPTPMSSLWSSFTSSSSSWASRDITQYLTGYPSQRDDPSLNDNLRFYSNEIRSRPDGDLIDLIHTQWWGDYERLEVHHGYIQWLFPLREEGMNSQIHPLQPHEMEAMMASPQCRARLMKSYTLILDFWGLSITDPSVGAVGVVSKDRLSNLIHSTHNYLRVTRVLKSLGELGMEEWKLGFGLRLWGVAQGVKGGRMKRSSEEYWLKVLKEEGDRKVVEEVLAGGWDGKDEEVYLQLLRRRKEEREGGGKGAKGGGGLAGKGDEERKGEEGEHKKRTEGSSNNEEFVKRRKGNGEKGEEEEIKGHGETAEVNGSGDHKGNEQAMGKGEGGRRDQKVGKSGQGDDEHMVRAMSLVEDIGEEQQVGQEGKQGALMKEEDMGTSTAVGGTDKRHLEKQEL